MRLTSALYRAVGEWSKKYANLPDRYINRRMELVYWRAPPNKPQYLKKKIVERKGVYVGSFRPWTLEYHLTRRQRHPLIEPILDWSFFRGDLVEVLVGMDKGKQGIVRNIIQERNWVIVDGLNAPVNVHERSKDGADPNHTVVRKEQPLLVTTDVALVDPSDLKPTNVTWRYTKDGEKVRVSVRTGRLIPIPATAHETIDYKTPELYATQSKDTPAEDAKALTFEPCLKTFEMDIMDKMGIKEERIAKRTYWY